MELTDLVDDYIVTELRRRSAHALLEQAQKIYDEADRLASMASAACRNVPKGVYAFKKHGRVVAVITPAQPYPQLSHIVE